MQIEPILVGIALGGDSRILLPLSALFVVACRRRNSLAEDGRWVRGLLVCIAAIAVLKVMTYSLFTRESGSVLVSPSGHVALAGYCFLSLSAAIASRLAWPGRWAVYLAGALIVAAVATSRVLLEQHTVPEVVTGAAVGLGCVVLERRVFRPRPRESWILAALIVVVVSRVGLLMLEIRPETVVEDLGTRLSTVVGLRSQAAETDDPLENRRIAGE
ncbi:MAG: phosphatase PAP2 family protein [Azospirillaceae bacterium]|nr:phosphatase PAP2 family protein [Azospirillaceae bacterium]